MNHTQCLTHFPRQVGGTTLDFDDWASKVRQQMMACLQKRRTDQDDQSTRKND